MSPFRIAASMPRPPRFVSSAWWPLARVAFLAAPLLLPLVVPLRLLGPFAAWLLTSGRWLVVAAVAASMLSLAFVTLDRPRHAGRRAAARLDAIPVRFFATAVFALGFLGMLALSPGYRWAGDGLLGDEPKYLRITESLYFDLDADVGSGTRVTPTPAGVLRNVLWLARTTAEAGKEFFEEEPTPPAHVWAAGHLTVAGRRGGLYHLQSPGLPVILLPGFALQRALWPDVTAPWLPLLTVATLWAFGLTQTVLLAEEVSGSRVAAAAAGFVTAFSPPVFLSGYHFYPEAAALALVPWLVRAAVGRAPGTWGLIVRGVAIGVLPWMHVKFSLVAAVLLVLIASRAGGRLAAAAVATPPVLLGALLALYHHRITGLATPDALYRRYGPEIYSGPQAFLSMETIRGVLIAFFGAVDGLFVMAPAAIAGALAIVWLFRGDPRRGAALAAVVAAVAAAAAVHGGGAPGPPGRLMAPVACVFGAFLAVGLVSMRDWPPFRWAVIILTLAGLAMTGTMRADWRRSVSPYRRMFVSPETDFARLLPGMPGPTRQERLRPDIARALALLAVAAFWAWRIGRAGRGRGAPDAAPATERWVHLRNTHLAFWATVAMGTVVLSALGP
jgi:hypothetical protein